MNSEKESTIFRQLAYLSIGSSVVCLILLLCSSIHLMNSADRINYETQDRGASYLLKTDALWAQFILLKRQLPIGMDSNVLRFTRSYDPFQEIISKCNKCVRLACPQGPNGLTGPSGADGTPGKSGDQGKPGEDGLDIVLGPVPDLPCTICPGGLPGPRGASGERGWPGSPGPKGIAGPPGSPGTDGHAGYTGPVGKRGHDGHPGLQGEAGKTVIAGVGAKGPRGLPGIAGYTGAIGLPGRSSNVLGPAGRQGQLGPRGKPGNPGQPGPSGFPGVPGEIGVIATYCPIACSKTKAQGVSTHHFAFPFASDIVEDDYETN